MLSVGQLSEGFVLDHIQAGKSMEIYRYLKLDELNYCVAIIKNARSDKMGKKDIIKVECSPEMLDLDVLGFIDHNITVNIIRDGEIVSQETAYSSEKNHQCDPLQESPLHHIYRAGTGSSLLPSRRGKRDLPLPVLRGEIPSFQ